MLYPFTKKRTVRRIALVAACAAVVACGGESAEDAGGPVSGSETPTYTVSGTVTGLTGTGLVLQDNGGDDLSIGANGPFAFPTALRGGATYRVGVLAQPTEPAQSCTVSSGSGIIGSSNVTSVRVTCVDVVHSIVQLGTRADDRAYGVAVDRNGNGFVAGFTEGDFDGASHGGRDAFLAKYDASGAKVWVRQLGTSAEDIARGVAVDGAGNAFVAGFTSGDLAGAAGGRDAFLAKYDASGSLLWVKQLGTSTEDAAYGVATDPSGNAFVAGYTLGSLGLASQGRDAFLAKYDASGNRVWVKQLACNGLEDAAGVAVDASGNAFVTGTTSASLYAGASQGSWDGYLAKYDPTGVQLWVKQFGSALDDHSTAIAVSASGEAVVAGYTGGAFGGAFQGGITDAFVARFDDSGRLVWARQLGTSETEQAHGVALDESGNAFVAGFARGPGDVFLAKYDPAGTQAWTRELRSNENDDASGVAVDANGNALVAGYTFGTLYPAVSQGFYDAFLARYGPTGELN